MTQSYIIEVENKVIQLQAVLEIWIENMNKTPAGQVSQPSETYDCLGTLGMNLIKLEIAIQEAKSHTPVQHKLGDPYQ